MQPWLIPMLYVIGAVAGGLTLPRIEHAWQTDAAIQAFELSVSSAQAYLSAAASGMMALTGIVFAMFRCGYCARAVARAGRRARSGRDRLHLRRLRPFPPPPPPAVPASLAAVNAAATEAGLADPTGGWQPPGRPDPWMAGATPAYAADPGAAQRAALYRQLNPTGTPIGVPPSAMANPPSTAAAPAPAAAWQPPATDRLVPTDEQPAPGGWQSAPVVANAPRLVPTDEMPAAKGNFFDDLIPQKQQTGSWQPPDAPQVPAKGMNVQGPNGVVVSFPDGTDPATVDQVMRQNFSGGGGSSPNSPQQGDASQWGPFQEGVNSFMFGAGPAVNEWLSKNAPTWMLSGAQPTTASQEQSVSVFFNPASVVKTHYIYV
jgi:hypothetical protein